jgi:chromosomal replication initiator protein
VSRPSTLDLETLWRDARDQVMRVVTSTAQRQWLEATRPVGYTDDVVVLATPHDFARAWLETRCGDLIRSALSQAAGRPLTVVITVQPRPEPVGDLGPADADLSRPPPSDPAPAERSPSGPSGVPSTDGSRQHRPTPPGLRDERREDRTWATQASRPPVRATDGERPADEDRPYGVSTERDRPLEAPGRPPGPVVELPEPRPRARDEVEPDSQLNPKYTFDDFVIGSSNRFAHAAAVAVAEAPAKSYNPLFIYGGAGLGKTHLLHAVGHYVRNLYPRLSVRYVTTEQFTNEFINAIRDDKRTTAFQRRYREADVLLIDDIQFLENKERTQEEFFHTFNALHNAEKQIVISQRPAAEADRPARGPAAQPVRVGADDRCPAARPRDAHRDPAQEVRVGPARRPDGRPRAHRLQGPVQHPRARGRPDPGLGVRQPAAGPAGLADGRARPQGPVPRRPRPGGRRLELIMDEVADYFSLTVEDLCSPSRNRQLVTARQIAMYLARELTDLSLPEVIGKAFGGRDHTTVMHANRKISRPDAGAPRHLRPGPGAHGPGQDACEARLTPVSTIHSFHSFLWMDRANTWGRVVDSCPSAVEDARPAGDDARWTDGGRTVDGAGHPVEAHRCDLSSCGPTTPSSPRRPHGSTPSDLRGQVVVHRSTVPTGLTLLCL